MPPMTAARYGADAFMVGLLSAAYPFMQFVGAPILAWITLTARRLGQPV